MNFYFNNTSTAEGVPPLLLGAVCIHCIVSIAEQTTRTRLTTNSLSALDLFHVHTLVPLARA